MLSCCINTHKTIISHWGRFCIHSMWVCKGCILYLKSTWEMERHCPTLFNIPSTLIGLCLSDWKCLWHNMSNTIRYTCFLFIGTLFYFSTKLNSTQEYDNDKMSFEIFKPKHNNHMKTWWTLRSSTHGGSYEAQIHNARMTSKFSWNQWWSLRNKMCDASI